MMILKKSLNRVIAYVVRNLIYTTTLISLRFYPMLKITNREFHIFLTASIITIIIIQICQS